MHDNDNLTPSVPLSLGPADGAGGRGGGNGNGPTEAGPVQETTDGPTLSAPAARPACGPSNDGDAGGGRA